MQWFSKQIVNLDLLKEVLRSNCTVRFWVNTHGTGTTECYLIEITFFPSSYVSYYFSCSESYRKWSQFLQIATEPEVSTFTHFGHLWLAFNFLRYYKTTQE